MNLPIPVPSQTGGPQYAQDEVSCFNQIDSHNHTSGQGVQIPLDGLNINQNLDMNNYSVTNLKSLQLNNSLVSPGSSSLFMLGNNLYFRDGTNSFDVQITSGASVNVPGSAGFTGLPSGTASAAFLPGSGTFRFESATNTGATTDIGPLKLRNAVASSNAVTITPSNPTNNYTLTLPNDKPASTKILQMTSTGSILNSLDVDNSTLEISGSTLQVKNLGIGTSQLANGSVTSAKLDSAALTVAPANRTPTTNTIQIYNGQIPTYPARWTATTAFFNSELIQTIPYTPSRTNVNLLTLFTNSSYTSYLYWARWNSGGPGPGTGGYQSTCYLEAIFTNPHISISLAVCNGGTTNQTTRVNTITNSTAGNIYIYFRYDVGFAGSGTFNAMFASNIQFNFVELN